LSFNAHYISCVNAELFNLCVSV